MSTIKESQDVRIKLHRIYDENILEKIITLIENTIPSVMIKFDSKSISLHITSSSLIIDKIDIIKSIINDNIISLTRYEYPELLYTVATLSPFSIIIEL